MRPPDPLRSVTDTEVDDFWRDGVVCLRGVLAPDDVAAMAQPVEETLLDGRVTTDMTALGDALAVGVGATVLVDEDARDASTTRGRFRSGVDHWRVHPSFAAFASRSALPAIVARLLRSERLWLYEDSVLVKEPGTHEPTAFHQDLAYFQVDGRQIATCWVPLDDNDESTGAVSYVIGSHLRDRLYRPNYFVTDEPIGDTEGDVLPDPRQGAGAELLRAFATAPGDIVVHHARTIHGARGNSSTTARRRAISVRYCGDDARYHMRRGAPLKPHQDRVADGDPLGGPDCPLVFPILDPSLEIPSCLDTPS